MEVVPLSLCPRCGQMKEMHPVDKHLCVDCVKVENNRVMYYRQHQDDWVNVAKEAGLDLWNQQPGETQWEFTVWTAYRDSYPGKRPSYADTALQLDTTSAAVRKIAQRWSFQMRMQAWMAECDRITLLQRRTEILGMNAAHISMAQKLRNKIDTAIDFIVPEALKPGEIAALAKLSAELERKAQVDTVSQEELRRDLLVDTENPELKKSQTKQSDLSEIVQILMKSGALGEIGQIGVRTTQEVIVKGHDGREASMISEG